MISVAQNNPGASELLMGNEAIARGLIEAGVQVAAAYPGTPSSEVIGELSRVAKELDIYVEWSTNEKVAAEVAAAASFAGLRAFAAMKNQGISVAEDFVKPLGIGGVKGGLIIMVADDPGGISSGHEQDVRWKAKAADVPLLEPSDVHEAKEMVKWAFELSEMFEIFVFVRSVTRISHTSGNVTLGELSDYKSDASFDTSKGFWGGAPVLPKHRILHDKLDKIQEVFESSSFNSYEGPERPELLMVCCGSGKLCCLDAVDLLNLEGRVGILKIGTTWPLPRRLIEKHLTGTNQVLIVEEVDPFLEIHLKELIIESSNVADSTIIYGKSSGHIEPFGEITPDVVVNALCKIFDLQYQARELDYNRKALDLANSMVVPRSLAWCPGCPHRASFWSIKNALKLDGRDGFVTGDIGCYALDMVGEGFAQIKTMHAMGSGTGLACGFGQLGRFGFNQPVIAACGDSTFYHSVVPALVNAVYSESDLAMVVFDNTATAMTGFQPHPGTGFNAAGDHTPVVDIEALCRSLGCVVEVSDPFDLVGTENKLLKLLEDEGKVRVLILRRKCALIQMREDGALYTVCIDTKKCKGEDCGCARLCTRVFKCPALIWDRELGKARIDEALCTGCGVCADICPEGAIVREVEP